MFYYFAVLRIDYRKTALLDLGPHPDATEYFAQAKALQRDGWPSIQIGYEKLPSRYPFGYPALMLPWLKICGKQTPYWHRFALAKRQGYFCCWRCLPFTRTSRCH